MTGRRLSSFALLALVITGSATGCAVFTSRPTQEFSDTSAAMRAAKEVQADVLAPELYRQADDWFIKARREFRLKNFRDAKAYAEKARRFAEQAEYEALRNGGNREEAVPKDIAPPTEAAPPPPAPYDYPTSTPTPAEDVDRKLYSPAPASPQGAPQ